MSSADPKFKNTGSLFILSGPDYIYGVNDTNKTITSTNNSNNLLSGSWGNYLNISSVFYSNVSESLKIEPGQKAKFEIVNWGDIGGSHNMDYPNTASDFPGSYYNEYFPDNDLWTGMSGLSYNPYSYKLISIENI
jgi:hypothetical protein